MQLLHAALQPYGFVESMGVLQSVRFGDRGHKPNYFEQASIGIRCESPEKAAELVLRRQPWSPDPFKTIAGWSVSGSELDEHRGQFNVVILDVVRSTEIPQWLLDLPNEPATEGP